MKINYIAPLMGLLAIAMLFLYTSCSKDFGNPTTRNYPIGGASYNGLNVSHAFQVTVSDRVTDVVVTVGEKAHDKVKVEVKDGTLYIGFDWINNYNGTATAIIPASRLNNLTLSGASTFSGDLSGNEVDIDLSGASVYNGNVTANDVDIDLSGASVATVTGSCQTALDLGLSGASELYAANLPAQIVKGDISGASTADVTCCNSVRVSLSGASHLTYAPSSSDCHPDVSGCSTTGASTVRQR